MAEQIARSFFSEVSEEANTLTGLGTPFYNGQEGSEYNLYGNVFERISPVAFAKSLEKEILCTFNHDISKPLGRTPNTLKVWVDEQGLKYSVDLPNTTTGNDVKEMVKRGDLRGSSFLGFVNKISWSDEGRKRIRTIEEIDLIELGPVTMPAYGATNGKLSLRSQELVEIKQEEENYVAKLETERRIERAKQLAKEMGITPNALAGLKQAFLSR